MLDFFFTHTYDQWYDTGQKCDTDYKPKVERKEEEKKNKITKQTQTTG